MIISPLMEEWWLFLRYDRSSRGTKVNRAALGEDQRPIVPWRPADHCAPPAHEHLTPARRSVLTDVWMNKSLHYLRTIYLNLFLAPCCSTHSHKSLKISKPSKSQECSISRPPPAPDPLPKGLGRGKGNKEIPPRISEGKKGATINNKRVMALINLLGKWRPHGTLEPQNGLCGNLLGFRYKLVLSNFIENCNSKP